MHSSWKIWDLFETKKHLLDTQGKLYCFQSNDPYIFKMIKDRILKDHFEQADLKVLIGKDVTLNWLEDNFLSLGLFGNSESYLVLMADEMKKECKDFLVKNLDKLILDNCYLILDFQKEDAVFKKATSHELVESIKITPPAFWESDKLLSFLCDYKEVYLSRGAKEYLLKNLTADTASFVTILDRIKLNLSDTSHVEVDDIESFVDFSRIDNFEFANSFATKRFQDFYSNLLKVKDFKDLRLIFSFMQSHLIKLADPSYSEFKAKKTKYDKTIMDQARMWNPLAIRKSINYFVELENMAKSKDPFLMSKIKKDALRVSHR